jgi:hypothetical protein
MSRRFRVRLLAIQNFSPLHSVQTGSGTHLVSYPVGTGALDPGVKRQGREADNSPPSSVEVKTGGVEPPLLHVSCLLLL